MKLNFVEPNMEKTFGTLTFAGKGKEVTKRVGGNKVTTGRYYHLYSSVQRADNIEVLIPASAKDKKFEFDSVVTLLDARIGVKGYSIGDKGFTDYTLEAADIIPVK